MFLKSYRGDANMNSLTVDTPSGRKVFTNKSLTIGEALSFIGQVRDRLFRFFIIIIIFSFFHFFYRSEDEQNAYLKGGDGRERCGTKKSIRQHYFHLFFWQHYFHLF
jgi:hypothetical protein